MDIPEQLFWVGQLVVGTEDHYWYFSKGEVGIITNAFCYKVCVQGGVNPKYAMEWGYVGLFDIETRAQGVRLDRLSPVEVICDVG